MDHGHGGTAVCELEQVHLDESEEARVALSTEPRARHLSLRHCLSRTRRRPHSRSPHAFTYPDTG